MEDPNANSSSDSTQERLIVKAKRSAHLARGGRYQSTIRYDRNFDGLPRSSMQPSHRDQCRPLGAMTSGCRPWSPVPSARPAAVAAPISGRSLRRRHGWAPPLSLGLLIEMQLSWKNSQPGFAFSHTDIDGRGKFASANIPAKQPVDRRAAGGTEIQFDPAATLALAWVAFRSTGYCHIGALPITTDGEHRSGAPLAFFAAAGRYQSRISDGLRRQRSTRAARNSISHF
jgi:hypothetical protein